MKKVLLITDVSFWEKSSGHRMRIYSLIEYLSAHVQLTVVNTGPAPANIETVLSTNFNADFFVLEKTKYLNSNGYGRRLKAFLKGRQFDTVIVEYIHSSYFLNFLPEDVQVILDAHDIISERADEFKKYNYAGALYELPEDTEREIFNVYDHIMVLCQPDYDKLNTMICPGKALLCPHPVQLCPHPVKEKVKNIAFIASAYIPNRDAINWFITNCWPHIAAKYDVSLSIYGSVGESVAQTDNRIFVKGFVPSLDQIYEDADIIINPVRFGAGLKIKNVEALAHGRPLVTTSHSARGIETGKNTAFLVADDAEEFIQSIGSLIKSEIQRSKLSKSAHKFIRDNFSADKCFKPLINLINLI